MVELLKAVGCGVLCRKMPTTQYAIIVKYVCRRGPLRQRGTEETVAEWNVIVTNIKRTLLRLQLVVSRSTKTIVQNI